MTWPNDIPGASVQRVVDAQAFLALEHSGGPAIQQWQTGQLTALIQWLLNQVPWWRERLGTRVNLNQWRSVPVLSRYELRKMLVMHGAAPVPKEHGAVTTPGAYGVPVASGGYFLSDFTQRLINHAYYADHQRQGRNPYAPHACIADEVPLHDGDHVVMDASLVHGSGPQALRNVNLFSKAQHIHWLTRHSPTYVTLKPDWFEVALVHATAGKKPLPEIQQILTYGATATDSLRRKARQWLGASVRHRYTCAECGPLAFQCPRSDDHLHVAVGSVILEVVDADGRLVAVAKPGEKPMTGRVLVTALHQYATPLVRYDTGDTASLHPGCSGCGLEVPTLTSLRQNV